MFACLGIQLNTVDKREPFSTTEGGTSLGSPCIESLTHSHRSVGDVPAVDDDCSNSTLNLRCC